MSFTNKKIKLKVFTLPKDAVINIEKIRANAACKLDELPLENGAQNIGWVAGKSELNISLTDEQIKVGENIYLAMRIATRRIPGSLLKAVLRQKIDEYKKLNNVHFVSAKVRKQLKEEAEQRLIRNATPTIKTNWCIITPSGKVYAGVANKCEVELFKGFFFKTLGVDLHPVLQVQTDDAEEYQEMKHEFLTWLFRLSDNDEETGIFSYPPFDFIALDEDKPCNRSVGYGFAAQHSPEVATALQNGKLLKKIKLCVIGENIHGYADNDVCRFTLNNNFSLVGLELPPGEEMEYVARFAEKIDLIDMLYSWLGDTLHCFCDEWKNDKENFIDRKKKWLIQHCG